MMEEKTNLNEKKVIHVIPQSHIDMAWLWQFDPETIHVCCPTTFGLATENLEKYSDYYFSQSQVPLYQATEKYYPAIFAKMEKFIKEGRWEIVGGMHNEFEGAQPCGESLVRHCLYGKKYFKERFNIDVTTAWQEDAWTHPWQLPQIFVKAGITSFMFKRGELNHRLFWWESPDGSRILTYKPLHTFRKLSTKEWKQFYDEMHQKYGIQNVMIRIGKGDHGGGPFAKDIEQIHKIGKELSPNIIVKFNSFANYIQDLLNEKPQLPTIKQELGFELTGDLTGCCELKKANRQSENLILTAEKFATFVSIYTNSLYPKELFDQLWDKLLFNQFHDIIGGSGLPEVCKDAERDYNFIQNEGNKILNTSLQNISFKINTENYQVPFIIFNPIAHTRSDIIELEIDKNLISNRKMAMRSSSGTLYPIQNVSITNKHPTKQWIIFEAKDLPSLGYETYDLVEDPNQETKHSSPSSNAFSLENAFFKILIHPKSGNISSIFDKRLNREIVPENFCANEIVLIEDKGDSEGRFKKGDDKLIRLDGKTRVINVMDEFKFVELGPIRKIFRVKYHYKKSSFIKDIIIYADIDRIDFNLAVDWHEQHLMMKVAFPINISSSKVTYDSAYCAVERPADGNEYPAQKWIDISNNEFGVALLNNSRYGHDVRENIMRINVLRSPTQPAKNDEEGFHTMEYSLMIHKGNWKTANVIHNAYEFNYRPICIKTDNHKGQLLSKFSFISVDKPNILLEVVKVGLDNTSIILRCCEMYGLKTDYNILIPFTFTHAEQSDLLENGIKGLKKDQNKIIDEINPFEIKTIKILKIMNIN